jgi:TrkA domain protein
MTVYESDLPGVGKKFEIEIGAEERLVIVTHNTGKRELFLKTSEGADSEKLFELPDRLARTVGTILEGAYFQPVQSEQVETMLTEGTFIEWYNVDEGSEVAGQTLADARVRERTGVSVAAIERAGSVVPSPQADTVIEAGDTLVVIGSQEDLNEFDVLVSNDADTPE